MTCQQDWHAPLVPPLSVRGTPFALSSTVARNSTKWRWVMGMTAALWTGCLSPTLPMPPPSKPDIEGPDSSGVVTLSGHAVPESDVYADNESTGYIYGQRTSAVTGAYRFPILASVGDTISMFYRLDGENSMSLKFVIRPNSNQTEGATAGAGGAGGGTNAPASAGSPNSQADGQSAGIAGSAGAT